VERDSKLQSMRSNVCDDSDATERSTSLLTLLIVIAYVILNARLFMFLHTLVESKLG
jgi:hypothetical protein